MKFGSSVLLVWLCILWFAGEFRAYAYEVGHTPEAKKRSEMVQAYREYFQAHAAERERLQGNDYARPTCQPHPDPRVCVIAPLERQP